MATAERDFVTAEEQLAQMEPRRVVDMAFEMDLVGASVSNAVGQLIETEDASWLLERVIDNKSSALTQSLIGSVDDFGRLLQQLLDNEAVDLSVLGAVLELVGKTALEPMMQAVVDTESRQVRRLLLDRLVTLQPEVGRLAIRHLDDPRWFVTRNMLWLLNGAEEISGEFVPDAYFKHEDHRVRYEAVRLGTRSRQGREQAIIHGLTDPEEKTVRLALNAALENCPEAALPMVVSWVSSGPNDLRILAVRVLETVRNETAVSTLLTITQPKRGLFRWKHPPKGDVYLAALGALHSCSDDPRVRTVLDLAQRRRDPEIADAARHGIDADG